MPLSVHQLTSRIGAVASGVDLSGDLDADTVAQIRAALTTHRALVLDDVHLDQAGHERFARLLGDLTTAHPTVPSAHGSASVLPVDSTESKANQWHTDVTFVVNPPAITTLRSVTVPPYGGETLVASSAGAYQDLPPALRSLADGLWAVHSNDYDYAVPPESLTDQQKAYTETFTSTVFETAHPVVRVHPETGERGLFIGGFVRRLVGLSATESRDLLRLLQSYVTRPENVLRWSWSPGQLLLFDNRITQHYAIDNYDDQPRRLERVTVAGDVPVSVDGTRSYVLQGDSSHYSAVAETGRAAA
jgi:alpha-ketoglutarate-dependent taurine dioxygenase